LTLFTLEELARVLGGAPISGDHQIEITGVEYDSRKVKPGNLFVCVTGFRQDGHAYARQAVDAGAVALVVERSLPELAQVATLTVENSREALARLAVHTCGVPARQLTMVGITGTNGKTTSSYFCEAVLKAKGKVPGLVGTMGAHVGGQNVPVANTTPESLDLQRLLAMMVDSGDDAAVLEVSSHALALDRVHGVPFDVAVFTNLTHDHLDFHPTLEDYFLAKQKLFKGLTYRRGRPAPYAVVNLDDAHGERIVAELRVPFITYGVHPRAHVRATDIDIHAEGSSFELETPVGSSRVNLRMSGMFNISNALAAIGMGLALKTELAEILPAIESVSSVRGRFELVREGQDFAVVVDYAHTPDGLENLLSSARKVTRGRVLTVFGCGGDRDRHKRPVMGEIASRLSDLAIVTSDNPRSESPSLIASEILAGVSGTGAESYVEIDRAAAIFKAIHLAQPGDTVVIAGKGHETYQIFHDKTIDFDDSEVARQALRGLGFRGQGHLKGAGMWAERRRAPVGKDLPRVGTGES
jgi:UDP-N-acetylmuramoyl-L-alanyl-D-glutamate--2,6-diaminopimelate ligase